MNVFAAVRVSHTTVAAALENLRIQLLRFGAGIGVPDDLAEEVAVLQPLLGTSNGQERSA